MAGARKRQIATLKKDVSSLVRDFQSKQETNEFLRPDTFVDLWRCLTKVRLLSRLESVPQASLVMDLANRLDIDPEKLINLANVGEWIQVDRDTRKWEDHDEYDEYWTCHYDGDQTVESYSRLREDIREIKELNTLWTN